MCPRCGRPLEGDFQFCPACGANLRPETAPEPAQGPVRSRMQFQGGLFLPGLYVPFGRQAPGTRRWGWMIAIGLLLLAIVPLLLSLLFSLLSTRF